MVKATILGTRALPSQTVSRPDRQINAPPHPAQWHLSFAEAGNSKLPILSCAYRHVGPNEEQTNNYQQIASFELAKNRQQSGTPRSKQIVAMQI
jgi:hypothetical protein